MSLDDVVSWSSSNHEERFAALPADPPPRQIIRGVHYWTGNEDRLDVFAPALVALRGQGGLFVGVGAEQNWILAGWSRPDVVVLMDFDQAVVDLHHAYVAAFRRAKTRQAFYALFAGVDGGELHEAVREAFLDQRQSERAWLAVREAKPRIARRLGRLLAHLPARGVSSFLTHDDDYAFVRSLILGGRVFVVRGDLTGPRTMKAIGEAARSSCLEMNTLYLSNAEQYFTYSERTKENFRALPWSSRSLVLRTHTDDGLPSVDRTPPLSVLEADLEYLPAFRPVDDFHYGIQNGISLLTSLASPATRTSLHILRHAAASSPRGLSLAWAEPTEATRALLARSSCAQHVAPQRTQRTAASTPSPR